MVVANDDDDDDDDDDVVHIELRALVLLSSFVIGMLANLWTGVGLRAESERDGEFEAEEKNNNNNNRRGALL
jgi:hypothetical protein